ncbi:MAG TPA: HAD family phosphatase [Fervidobacterium sp.]|nr:HAD family phosphatase [Fervidobacterium sp.]HPZ17955.1 HAD family phosphatase [Fervidobacterium sp.]HQE49046.1 HAD family phosphatase [Fervidobacterium sp.]HRD20212.1 HAD family phosphatase [Fervidobacterium sp.]HUM42871.1 HAD family phosphatase [Fervidobacterium sp.]
MIKNIVFDLGRVLVKWYPCEYAAEMFGEKVAEEICAKVYNSPDWTEIDRGTIKEAEFWERKKKELPHLEKELEHLSHKSLDFLESIEENTALILPLKNAGYNLYVLSNFNGDNFDAIYKKYEFFRYFDGLIVSSWYQMVKPEREIFMLLINKFNLKPAESLYIDDNINNVKVAEEFGFLTIHLANYTKLREKLEEFGIIV